MQSLMIWTNQLTVKFPKFQAVKQCSTATSIREDEYQTSIKEDQKKDGGPLELNKGIQTNAATEPVTTYQPLTIDEAETTSAQIEINAAHMNLDANLDSAPGI